MTNDRMTKQEAVDRLDKLVTQLRIRSNDELATDAETDDQPEHVDYDLSITSETAAMLIDVIIVRQVVVGDQDDTRAIFGIYTTDGTPLAVVDPYDSDAEADMAEVIELLYFGG